MIETKQQGETREEYHSNLPTPFPGLIMYVDFVYWYLILVTPDGHTFVCAVLPDLSA
jgi:hypothetical protein